MVIDYLAKPWFYSILGNHEWMLIDAYENDNDHSLQQWYRWGGEWAEDLDKESLEAITRPGGATNGDRAASILLARKLD